jgi:hypothetical protein
MDRAQLRLAKLAYKVADGKATMSEYRAAEKKHNRAIWETKQ